LLALRGVPAEGSSWRCPASSNYELTRAGTSPATTATSGSASFSWVGAPTR